MKGTTRLVWSAVLGATALVCLLLTIFPFATIGLPALASVCFVPIVIEFGRRWTWAVYTAVALLSLLITPDLEAKMLFIAFFGYYPIIKSWAEMRPRRTEWIVKFAVFNTAMITVYAVLAAVGLSLEEFRIEGVLLSLPVILGGFLLAGNVIFLLYDRVLSLMVPLYYRRLRPLFLRMFH